MIKYSYFFFFLVKATSLLAMQGDTLHSPQDYVNFANENQHFEAAGYLIDSEQNISQSGVLIAPNLFLTAAHGVVSNKTPSLIKVGFSSPMYSGEMVRAKSVTIDARYSFEPSGLYDFALIELEEPINSIQPISFLPQSDLKEPYDLTVVTFGAIDIIPGLPIYRRAFKLLETDAYYYPERILDINETVAFSSVFFSPFCFQKNESSMEKSESLWEKIKSFFPFWFEKNEKSYEIAEDDEELKIRSQKAFQNWIQQGKPPYGLALPGSSGAPVFIKVNHKYYLFGLITSFAHLSMFSFHSPKGESDAEYILSCDKKEIYGRYQTVFATFYKRKILSKDSFHYSLDSEVKALLSHFSISTQTNEQKIIESKNNQ